MRQKSLVMSRAVLVFILLLLFPFAFTVYGEGDTGINLERRVKQFTETMDGKEYVLSSCEYDVINTTQSPSLGLKLFLAKYNEMTAKSHEGMAENLQENASYALKYRKMEPNYYYRSNLSIERHDSNVLSFFQNYITYMGGSAVSKFKELHNVDALTGKRISLSDSILDYEQLAVKIFEKSFKSFKKEGENDNFMQGMYNTFLNFLTDHPDYYLLIQKQGLDVYIDNSTLPLREIKVRLSLEDLEGIVDLGPYK